MTADEPRGQAPLERLFIVTPLLHVHFVKRGVAWVTRLRPPDRGLTEGAAASAFVLGANLIVGLPELDAKADLGLITAIQEDTIAKGECPAERCWYHGESE